MRFKEFLREGTQAVNVTAEQIYNDCQSYFKAVRLTGNELTDWMWHGTKHLPSNRHPVYVVDAKTDREPRDTPLQVHNAVNDYFKQQYGKPFRNGVFATGYYSDAAIYSRDHSAWALIPIGHFSWLCSAEKDGDFRDLTGLWRRTFEEVHRQLSKEHPNLTAYDVDDMAIPDAIEALIDHIHGETWYFNEALSSCIKSQNEIMLWCSKFYLIDRHSPQFKELYQLAGQKQ
jgi:hypothetical protein